jgi:CheY-like chemotaxis protein
MLPASVELAADIRDDTPPVLADPTSIHQILLNLCTNSWHALEGRPGRISIALGPADVDEARCRAIANLHPGRYARLAVTDNGAGMAASTMERAFDPFFTTKPVGKGTGLGLSVVHGLVQNHGGAVAVSSELGNGATFEVFLPEHLGENPGVPDRAPNAQPSHGAGETILYVDDEPTLVSLARRMLERTGYRVCGFSDPKAALARLEANPTAFDLIVTDYNMPGFSGLQLASAAARLSPKLPIVLISGYITKELEVQAAAAGVRAFISKPNIASELRETVRRFLPASRQDSSPGFVAAGI